MLHNVRIFFFQVKLRQTALQDAQHTSTGTASSQTQGLSAKLLLGNTSSGFASSQARGLSIKLLLDVALVAHLAHNLGGWMP